MARVKYDFRQLRHFNENLRKLVGEAEKIMKFTVFEGADIAANELRAGVEALRTVSDGQAIQAYRKRTPTILSKSQKQGLLDGLGISPMKTRGGGVDNKVGFEGYNSVVTRRWPNGQPNIMIAASCEHGSSAMLEQPFIRQAYQRCAHRVTEAMAKVATEKIEEILDK